MIDSTKRSDLREISLQVDPSARRQDNLLLGFLCALFVLFREASVDFDRALPMLLLLLGSNWLLLRIRRNQAGAAALAAIGVNSLLIGYLIECSGGAHSPLWPLHLLPVFTAGLALPSWTMRTAGLQAALMLCAYVGLPADAGWLPYAECFFKCSFLLMASWHLAKIGVIERRRADAAQAEREILESLIEAETQKKSARALFHSIFNGLTVIRGLAQIAVLESANKEMKTIDRAAKRVAEELLELRALGRGANQMPREDLSCKS